MRIISDVIIFFTNSIFCECFSITNLYTRIVERNNEFLKKIGFTLVPPIEGVVRNADVKFDFRFHVKFL